MDILYDSKNLKFDFYEIYYQAAYLEDDLYIEAIADGHHFPDTLLRLMVKNKGYDKMILVTDSMSAAGFGDGLFYLGNPEDHHQVLIKNGVGFMPDMSSFAGSVACTDQLVRTMLKIGVPINQAVKMLSLIAIGKRADLLIFDESIDMKYVFVDGDLRYKK